MSGWLTIIVPVVAMLVGCGTSFAQGMLRENPGLTVRPMVVRVIPHGPAGEDKPAGFGIIMGERDGQFYVATADHVVRDGAPDTLTDHPDIVFFHERPNRRPAERLPERLPPESGDLAVLRIRRPADFTAVATSVLPTASLSWGMPVWNVGRNGEWIVPTSPGGFQDWQPRTGLLVLDRIAAPPGASGSAAVATDGLLGMIVIDAGRGDVAYALPAETIVRQFKTWRFPVSIPVSTTTPAVGTDAGDSPAVHRAAYERSAHNCDLVADPRDFSRPVDVPGTSLGARVIVGAMPPMGPIIEACRLAVEGFPEVPRYRYQLGVALELSGNKPDAAAAFRAAKQAGHEYSSVILNRLSR